MALFASFRVEELMTNAPTLWLISGPILCLYIAAAAATLVLRVINERAYTAPSQDKPMPPAIIALITFVSNFLIVASLVLLGNALSSATRLSMLAVPLILLGERYVRIIIKEPEKRYASAYALGGSVAGLLAGAWTFMRQVSADDALAHAILAPDVATVPVQELIKNQGNWAVSLQLVAFYVIAIAIFVSLHSLLQMAAKKIMNVPQEKFKERTALAALLAFVLNFMGVVVLILIAQSSNVQLRLAMVGFPLFLIAESYARVLRSEPENRPSNWTGLIGSGGGMVLASFFLLRGAPLH
jgi:hypothetical protein